MEANTIVRARQRPWVTLRREAECDFHEGDGKYRLSWNLNLENLGATPAFDVRLGIKVIKRDRFSGLRSEIHRFAEEAEKSSWAMTQEQVLFPGEKTNYVRGSGELSSYFASNDSVAEESRTFVLVCLTYHLDIGGLQKGIEARVLWVKPADDTAEPNRRRMAEVSSERIVR